MAGGSRVARLTQAECGACQGVGAALGLPVAWLAQTHVLHVAQEACRAGLGETQGPLEALSLMATSLLHPAHCPTPGSLTCASRWAEAGEGAHTIDAGGAGGTGGRCTVIKVLLTAWASPAAHTYTVEATGHVLAGPPIPAAWGALSSTFIHIFRAIQAYKGVERGQ